MSEKTTDNNMQRIEEMFKQISVNMLTINQKMELLMKDVEVTKQENVQLKKQVAEQHQKIQDMEKEIRRKNIVIKGVEDKYEEKSEEINEKLKAVFEQMKINIDSNADIDEVKRMGKHRVGIRRPIIVKMLSGRKKTEILKQTKALRGTDIWIEEDYPKEILKERKSLIPHLKEARQKGYNVKLRYNKLIVNNEIFTIKELEQTETQTEMITDKKRTFSERSPEMTNPVEREKKMTKTALSKN